MQNISLESLCYGLLTIFVLRCVVGLLGYILPFRKSFMFIFLIFWGDFIIYYGCTCQRTFPFVALLNILCMQSLIIMVKLNFGLLLRFCQIQHGSTNIFGLPFFLIYQSLDIRVFISIVNTLCMQSLIIMVKLNFGLLLRFYLFTILGLLIFWSTNNLDLSKIL